MNTKEMLQLGAVLVVSVTIAMTVHGLIQTHLMPKPKAA